MRAFSLLAVAIACGPAPVSESLDCPDDPITGLRDSRDVCVCANDLEVFSEGAAECESCRASYPDAQFCQCADGTVLTEQLASCSLPSACGPRERPSQVSGECVSCAKDDCGASCGDCPADLTCVGGKCSSLAFCCVSAVGCDSEGPTYCTKVDLGESIGDPCVCIQTAQDLCQQVVGTICDFPARPNDLTAR